MIDVHQNDQDYQRVLWRALKDDQIEHYRLTTVTYGTRPAPYLAIRTLLQLSKDERINFPVESKAITDSFYVDDCMAGANSIDEAQDLARQINCLLLAGGFQLRKWVTNDKITLLEIPDEHKVESLVELPTELTVCLLGVIWKPSTDTFSYWRS